MDYARNFNTMMIRIFFKCIYKQPVHKQLAQGLQITKQLSGPNPLSQSNNKSYKLKKNFFEFFLCSLCNKRKIVIKSTIHSQKHLLRKF